MFASRRCHTQTGLPVRPSGRRLLVPSQYHRSRWAAVPLRATLKRSDPNEQQTPVVIGMWLILHKSRLMGKASKFTTPLPRYACLLDSLLKQSHPLFRGRGAWTNTDTTIALTTGESDPVPSIAVRADGRACRCAWSW